MPGRSLRKKVKITLDFCLPVIYIGNSLNRVFDGIWGNWGFYWENAWRQTLVLDAWRLQITGDRAVLETDAGNLDAWRKSLQPVECAFKRWNRHLKDCVYTSWVDKSQGLFSLFFHWIRCRSLVVQDFTEKNIIELF